MNQARQLHQIRRLIWVYFFLLIGEGILRKWILPSLSNPLLIIRDPLVIAIYVLAYRRGIFPRNTFMLWGSLLALPMFIFGVLGEFGSFPVALYGLRTDFLHLPLIFVMAKVWTTNDVKQVGRWMLLLAVPLALLMTLQFQASPSAWLNAGAGGLGAENGQIASAGGHIRPSATFSFISGPVLFFAVVCAFLFFAQLSQKQYPSWLVIAAAIALLLATAVSGSRSVAVNLAIVAFCALICSTLIQPFLMFRWLGAAALIGVLALAAQNLSVAREGVQIFSQRVSNASSSEGGSNGFVRRALNEYAIMPFLQDAPFLGYGLGAGTNAGAALLTGKRQFLFAEGEWTRVVQESGPVLGFLFLTWRVAFAGWLGWICLKHAMRGNTLPFLLFGACGINIINGQWGVPTTQGFTVFVGGLCLASTRMPLPSRRRARPKNMSVIRPVIEQKESMEVSRSHS